MLVATVLHISLFVSCWAHQVFWGSMARSAHAKLLVTQGDMRTFKSRILRNATYTQYCGIRDGISICSISPLYLLIRNSNTPVRTTPLSTPLSQSYTTAIMVRISAIIGLIVTMAMGVQAGAYCQCLKPDGSHCCIALSRRLAIPAYSMIKTSQLT